MSPLAPVDRNLAVNCLGDKLLLLIAAVAFAIRLPVLMTVGSVVNCWRKYLQETSDCRSLGGVLGGSMSKKRRIVEAWAECLAEVGRVFGGSWRKAA